MVATNAADHEVVAGDGDGDGETRTSTWLACDSISTVCI